MSFSFFGVPIQMFCTKQQVPRGENKRYLEGLFAILSEGSQCSPLVADHLTAAVDAGRVVVVQITTKKKKPQQNNINKTSE